MTKSRIDKSVLLSTTALTTSAVSTPLSLKKIDNVGIQVVWSAGSGSPAGTVTVGASNDGISYSDLTLSATPVITGNSGNLLISLNQVPFSFIRATVTMSAGSITAVVTASGAEI